MNIEELASRKNRYPEKCELTYDEFFTFSQAHSNINRQMKQSKYIKEIINTVSRGKLFFNFDSVLSESNLMYVKDLYIKDAVFINYRFGKKTPGNLNLYAEFNVNIILDDANYDANYYDDDSNGRSINIRPLYPLDKDLLDNFNKKKFDKWVGEMNKERIVNNRETLNTIINNGKNLYHALYCEDVLKKLNTI